MKRDEWDVMIQSVLEKQTERLEADPMMLERVKREAASSARKERFSMKLFTPKRIAAIAVVCFASVTCYAAVNLSGTEAKTTKNITSYAQIEKAEEKMGMDMKTVETFSNGFTFVEGGTGEVTGQDENGTPTGATHPMMTLVYEKDGKNIMITGEKGDIYADAGEETVEGYRSQLYKFVPEGYELTAEDKAKEMIISYGADEVTESMVETYTWMDNGVLYTFVADDISLGEEAMTQMAEELRNS